MTGLLFPICVLVGLALATGAYVYLRKRVGPVARRLHPDRGKLRNHIGLLHDRDRLGRDFLHDCRRCAGTRVSITTTWVDGSNGREPRSLSTASWSAGHSRRGSMPATSPVSFPTRV